MAHDNIRLVKPNMEFVDGYFFTMDETRKSLIQKTDDGSTAFEYPCQTNPGHLIYFDNFNTNTYDPDQWTLAGIDGGFRDGKFWSHDAAGGSSKTMLYHKFRARGTYDIRIDYNLIIYPSVNSWGATLSLRNRDANNTYLQISRRYTSAHTYYCDVNNGSSWSQVGRVSTSDTYGSLRFYRAYNSSSTTCYYKSPNGSWTSFGSTSTVGIGASDNVEVRVYMDNFSSSPECESEFDNFYMSIALSTIKSLQYDGTYFWTLQEILGTSEPVIRKWLVRNYVCELIDEFVMENSAGNLYDSDAFAVEHYITELTSTVSGGDNIIHMNEYYDTVVTSGTILSLGHSNGDYTEDVVVSEVVGSDVLLSSGLLYDHSEGDKVITSPSLFLFNNYTGTSSTNGSLIRFDAHTGNYITSDSMNEYKNVTASTFARLQNTLRGYDDASAVVFVKNTEARFRNMSDLLSLTDAYSANDDFTGSAYSIPDTSLWGITQGNPRILDNKLFCSTVIGGYDELTSNYLLTGDFDVQVSGSLPTPYEFQTFTVTVADDFTNVSGSLLDDSMWSIDTNSVSGTALIYNNKLRITIPETPNDEYIHVVSKFYLKGDFDIQLDYEEISNDPPSSSYSYPVNFRVWGVNDYSSVGIWLNSTSDKHMVVNGNITSQTHVDTVYTSGKLRMTRTGAVIKSYYWTGSQWEWNGSVDGFTHGESFVEDAYVVIRTAADYGAGAVTEYDNFSATYRYGQPSVSDAFTGVSGAPDSFKWQLNYPEVSIYNNRLKMTANASKTYEDIRTVYYLKGDFDIQVDYYLVTLPAVNHGRCAMEVRQQTSGWTYRIERWHSTAHYYAAEQYNGTSWSTVKTTSTTHTSGKIRFTRVGSTLTNYYWSGSSWTTHYTWTTAQTDPVQIRLFTYVSTNYPSIEINFDNFIVNSADEVDYCYYLHGIRLKFPYTYNYWYELIRRTGIDSFGDCITTRYNNGTITNHLKVDTTTNDYMLRLRRVGSTIYSYYKPVTSGIVPSEWISIGSMPFYDSDCIISPYLYSQNVTVSGSYFDDLEYTDGTIRYPSSTIPYYGIMTIDNIKADQSTIIPVYDLSYSHGTLYRLQDEGTYYGVNNDWGSQYNYVVSPVRPFVDAITIEAYPTILPANGRNVAEVNCLVLDQFANGAIDRPISFTDNDAYGYVTINPKNTDNIFGTGATTTYYKAGIDVHTVTIQATVTQYD